MLKRDVRANGNLISETNPYVMEGHPGDGADSPVLLITWSHDGRTLDIPESSLPAAGMTELASSSEGGSSNSPSQGKFNLHSDTAVTDLQVAAAALAPIGNDGQ